MPVLTLSYSDLITSRGFKYVFQTAAPASRQSELGLPTLMKLAESASGKRPKTVAMLMDNTATSIATAKALKEKLLAQEGLQLVVEEIWTPPLSDATPLIQKVRSARPDLLLFMPNAVSDAKLGLEKINEFGLGQGKIPTVSFSITIAEPDMLQSVNTDAVQGIMTIVADWGSKGQKDLIAELKAKYKEPWATQNFVSTYGDMWMMKEALEKAGKADRQAVAKAFRTLDARTVEILSGRRTQIRREGPPRRRRRGHRAVAERRAGHRLSARPGAGHAVLAEEILKNNKQVLREDRHDWEFSDQSDPANIARRRIQRTDCIPRLGATAF